MARTCPACAVPLVEEAAPGRYGTRVVVDHCRTCGGLYFDRAEVYRLGEEMLGALADAPAPPPPGTLPPGAACPGCGAPMRLLAPAPAASGPSAWRCPACHGVWMSEAALRAFLAWRVDRLRRLREAAEREERGRERREPEPPAPPAPAADAGGWLWDRALLPLAIFAAPPWFTALAVLAEWAWPVVKARLRLDEDPVLEAARPAAPAGDGPGGGKGGILPPGRDS